MEQEQYHQTEEKSLHDVAVKKFLTRRRRFIRLVNFETREAVIAMFAKLGIESESYSVFVTGLGEWRGSAILPDPK